MLDKWKQAVIHLECATDSEHHDEMNERLSHQKALLDQGTISMEEYADQLGVGTRDVRYHGTALFLRHAGRRYLLTARHVVWDGDVGQPSATTVATYRTAYVDDLVRLTDSSSDCWS